MAWPLGVVVQLARAARRELDIDMVRQPLPRPKGVVPVAHDDGRAGIVDIEFGFRDGLAVPGFGIAEGGADRQVAFAPFHQPLHHLGALGGVARGHHHVRHGPALGVVAVEQGGRAMSMAYQGELPAQVEGVLKPGVHSVALRRAARMRGVASQQHAAGTESLGDLRVAIEPGGMRDVFKAGVGQIALQRGQGVHDQVGLRRTGPQIDAPALAGQRRQDDGYLVQVGVIGFERMRPVRDAGVEHRPGLVDVVPVLLDAREHADGAVVAVAPDHPLGQDVGQDAIMFQGGEHAVVLFPQADKLGGAGDRAAQPFQVLGQHGFGDLFRYPDVVRVAAAAQRQVDDAKYAAASVDAGPALLDARGQQGLENAQRIQDFE
ncbi:hypothetical protein D3C72_1142510 [compost metagenome]